MIVFCYVVLKVQEKQKLIILQVAIINYFYNGIKQEGRPLLAFQQNNYMYKTLKSGMRKGTNLVAHTAIIIIIIIITLT